MKRFALIAALTLSTLTAATAWADTTQTPQDTANPELLAQLLDTDSMIGEHKAPEFNAVAYGYRYEYRYQYQYDGYGNYRYQYQYQYRYNYRY